MSIADYYLQSNGKGICICQQRNIGFVRARVAAQTTAAELFTLASNWDM